MIGTQKTLKYPSEFVTLPEYTAHAGQLVFVVRELEDGKEYDYEGDKMYEVRASDGWVGSAYESELADILHFGSWDDRFCGFKGTHQITADENEVNCPHCKSKDRIYLTEQGRQALRDLGYAA